MTQNRLFHGRCTSCYQLGGLLLLAAVALAPLQSASASDRIALVIGNGGYAHLDRLDHVIGDVSVMADTLRHLNFDVDVRTDLDQRSMQAHLDAFEQRIDLAGGDALGLLFYAGHGVQHDGSNYLLPVDARIENADDVDLATINLDRALARIAGATDDQKLIILDVPSEEIIDRVSGVSPGLGAIDAPAGTLVAYGAMPGISNDEQPPYQGLYPLALANALAKPGLLIEQVFQNVRLNVAEATGGLQIPWESSALEKPVYLSDTPKQDQSGANGITLANFDDVDLRTVDLVSWIKIKDSTDPVDFQNYLDDFPGGIFRQQADQQSQRLAKLGTTRSIRMSKDREVDELHAPLFTQRRAHVRAEPSDSGVIIDTIETRQKIQVTGLDADQKWYQTRLSGHVEAFIRASLLGPAPSSSALDTLDAGLPPSKRALLGAWSGEYQCQWDTIGFNLNIVDDQDGEAEKIKAIFSFFPLPGAPSFPAGSFSMTGEYDADDGTLLLQGDDWIEQPLGFERHDIAGHAEIGGASIIGRVETPGCSDFVLSRDGDQDLSTTQSVSTQ